MSNHNHELETALSDLLRAVIMGTFGPAGNPYSRKEVRRGLAVLAKIQGEEDWMLADVSERDEPDIGGDVPGGGAA